MTSPTAELVRSSTTGGVATLTLDSPRNRNALSKALIGQLLDALAAAVADPAAHVILLTHTGPVFCSGVDLAETAAATETGELPAARISERSGAAPAPPSAAQRAGLPAEAMGELLAAVWECPKPVVARVGGPARAGGLGLVAAADIAVCAAEATFAFTEVRLGVVPAVISATVLPRLTSRGAAELYLTGDVFDGVRAAQVGLVTAAVPAADLDATVTHYTTALVRGAPGALAGTKRLLRRPTPVTFRDELAELTALTVSYFRSAEGREGVAAFREKRDPYWIPVD
jgi:methylglutaconyl-CoA hydratase